MTALYVASNPRALGSQVQLQRNVGDLGTTLERLSTGLRINSAKDDPAGMIASETLKSDIVATKQAIQNTTRANNVLAVADGALGEVSSILTDIRGLINSTANEIGTSSEEAYANQLMIDASIDSIDRIAQTTVFKGQKILDGSLGFQTSNVDNKAISNLQVNSASLGSGGAMNVQVDVLEAAKKATLIHKGGGVGEDTTLNVGGSQGNYTFSFAGGTDVAQIADAVNRQSEVTGVTASLEGEASHGNVVLSSTGANNDIVVTAKNEGFDAGNYSFRVVQGAVNDAYIVRDPSGSDSGIVEISLQAAYTKSFSGVADALDITLMSDTATTPVSVSYTRGTENKATLATAASNASATTADGTKVEVTAVAAGGYMSNLNGWTFTMVDAADTRKATFDDNAKIAYVENAAAATVTAATRIAGGTATVALTPTTGTWAVGESITFSGGAAAGELQITYKEGATAGEIATLINNLDGAQATVSAGVSNNTLIADVPTGVSRLTGTTDQMSSTTSQVSATDVVALINNKLGNMFDAALMTGDSGSGNVTFQDSSAIYGSVASDNAIQFSGMDSGPVVRLVTGGSNKELGVTLRNPTEEDKANGITTQVLEVQLATNASGNSKTTAADIVNLFNSLSAEATGGVSASLLLPADVDPNGRVWSTDSTGCSTIDSFTGACAGTYGTGICSPTGVVGSCGMQENDICLLGANEKIVETNAMAYVANSVTATGAAASTAEVGANAQVTIETTGNTSSLNGVTFNFTDDAEEAGFDDATGTLTVFLHKDVRALHDATDINPLLTQAVNGAIQGQWEQIRSYTNSTEGPATVTATSTGTTTTAPATPLGQVILNELGTGTAGSALLAIPSSNAAGATGAGRGVGVNDSALIIEAKAKGTELAGTQFQFVQSDVPTGEIRTAYDEDTGVFTVSADATGINAFTLAGLLNDDALFQSMFEATSPILSGTTTDVAATGTTGTVAFSDSTTAPTTTMVGGLEVFTGLSSGETTGAGTASSSGIAMRNNSDENLQIVFQATEAGSDNYVSINVINGTFNTECPLGTGMSYLAGTDAVVNVGGQKATAQGNSISTTSGAVQVQFELSEDMDSGDSTRFTINGGGAVIQMGPDVVASQQLRIGIPSVSSMSIGGKSGFLADLRSDGKASVLTDTKLADKIIKESIASVNQTRARIGVAQGVTLAANQVVLEDTLEQLIGAEASYSNADFAEESVKLTQAQILVSSASQALALSAQFPQYAAQLIR